MKIIVRNPRLEEQGSSPPENRSADQAQPVRPVSPTGQTGSSSRSDCPGDRPRTFKPKRPEVGTWKTNEVKVQGRTSNQKPSFNQLLNKYTKAVQNDRPLKKRPRSPPRQDRLVSPRRESSRRRGDVVTLYPPQMCATMPWVPPASNAINPAWEHGGIWMQCFPMPYPPHYQGESSRVPMHDRLGPRQSGPVLQDAPVRPVSP